MPEHAKQKKMPNFGDAYQVPVSVCPNLSCEEHVDTHCGLGAPQSTHLLFSLVLEISSNLLRVSGSTSHILLILTVVAFFVVRGLRCLERALAGVDV